MNLPNVLHNGIMCKIGRGAVILSDPSLTERVIADIQSGKELDTSIKPSALPSVAQLLNVYMGRRGMSTEVLFEQAGLSRSYGFRVLNGSRKNLSRDAVLRLAFVLGLAIHDAQFLLKCAMNPLLSGHLKRDVIIMKALNDHKLLSDIQDILISYQEKPLLAE